MIAEAKVLKDVEIKTQAILKMSCQGSSFLPSDGCIKECLNTCRHGILKDPGMSIKLGTWMNLGHAKTM